MELYRWQRECLRAWEAAGWRGIVHVATGAGKTAFALAAIDALRERQPTLEVFVVVPTVPLARQWTEALTRRAPSEEWRPGLYGGGRQDEGRRAMIYIVNSARDALVPRLRRTLALGHAALLICDECHHLESEHNRRIFGFITPQVLSGSLYASLGLSATPFGAEGGSVLSAALGPVIYRYGVDAAVAEGVLSGFIVGEVAASFHSDEAAEYARQSDILSQCYGALLSAHPELRSLQGARFIAAVTRLARAADMDLESPAVAWLLASWRRREISSLARARIDCCVSLLEQARPGNRTLVFCERISQAEALCRAMPRRLGDAAAIYHSKLSREARARNLELFRTGERRTLISCRCLDEGIDVPEANVGIVLSGTAVQRQRVQRLGRVIRTAPGKDAACLYYIYIRQSADDPVYLPELERCECFALRYYAAEDAFSNQVYEYVAAELLRRAAEKGLSPEQQRELRACLLEGLTRPDCLLPPQVLKSRADAARTTRERNYWRAMAMVAERLER